MYDSCLCLFVVDFLWFTFSFAFVDYICFDFVVVIDFSLSSLLIFEDCFVFVSVCLCLC